MCGDGSGLWVSPLMEGIVGPDAIEYELADAESYELLMRL